MKKGAYDVTACWVHMSSHGSPGTVADSILGLDWTLGISGNEACLDPGVLAATMQYSRVRLHIHRGCICLSLPELH